MYEFGSKFLAGDGGWFLLGIFWLVDDTLLSSEISNSLLNQSDCIT